MKYRIRNIKQHEALERLIPNFSEELEKAVDRWARTITFDNEQRLIVVPDLRDPIVPFRVFIDSNQVILNNEFNPNSWNFFPDVTPPEGVLMMLRMEDDLAEVGFFKDGAWHYANGIPMTNKAIGVKKFKPWED